MIPENIGLNINCKTDCSACCPRSNRMTFCCCKAEPSPRSPREEKTEKVKKNKLKETTENMPTGVKFNRSATSPAKSIVNLPFLGKK